MKTGKNTIKLACALTLFFYILCFGVQCAKPQRGTDEVTAKDEIINDDIVYLGTDPFVDGRSSKTYYAVNEELLEDLFVIVEGCMPGGYDNENYTEFASLSPSREHADFNKIMQAKRRFNGRHKTIQLKKQ